MSSLKLEPFADLVWLLSLRAYTVYCKWVFWKRGRTISVDLSLFVLFYNTNFMNKLKFNDFFKLKIFFFNIKITQLSNLIEKFSILSLMLLPFGIVNTFRLEAPVRIL